MRPAASLAAGVLLSCALAPAHADQPDSPHPAARSVPGPRTGKGTKPTPECKRLRAAILESEQSDRRLRAAMMESVQQDLLILRQRYRKLGCRSATKA